MKDAKYWLGLKLIPHVDRRFNQLLSAFGGPSHIWKASVPELSSAVAPEVARKIALQRRNINLDEELQKLADARVELLPISSPVYPKLLKEIPSPPPVLFARGRVFTDPSPAIAIVGSRRASSYGKALAEEFAGTLTKAGLTVVSGFARGIDSASHQGAIKAGGNTVGVLGTGLDVIYPPENRRLYDQIQRSGTFLSEHHLGTPALAYHFPPRNRIISGLSLGVVVIEANEKSGALITADFALEQGREVFAVPGHVKSSLSRGTHKLLKQGALLAENPDDVLDALRVGSPSLVPEEKTNVSNLSPSEKELLETVGWQTRHVDEISRETNLSASETSSLLTILELKGYIKQEAGQRYLRIQ